MNLTDKLKERYSDINSLIFQRSVDRAKSDVELFDILDTIPSTYPIIWDEKENRWVHTDDIFQSQSFREKL